MCYYILTIMDAVLSATKRALTLFSVPSLSSPPSSCSGPVVAAVTACVKAACFGEWKQEQGEEEMKFWEMKTGRREVEEAV